MKKILLITILLISSTSAFSQLKFGFRVAPTLTYSRVNVVDAQYDIENNNSAVRFQIGPTFDYGFRENHYISSGIYFATKNVDLNFRNQNTGQITNEETTLSYIQVPLGLKLFTEEVGLDKKLYFQFGVATDIRTQGIQNDDQSLLQQVDLFNFSSLLALGMEYRFGVNTKFYGGFFYNRGFNNAVKNTAITGEWKLYNDQLGLELGVTF